MRTQYSQRGFKLFEVFFVLGTLTLLFVIIFWSMLQHQSEQIANFRKSEIKEFLSIQKMRPNQTTSQDRFWHFLYSKCFIRD